MKLINIFKAFSLWSLTLMAAAILMGDIVSEHSQIVMVLWAAVIGELLIEKPVSALWQRK